MPKTREEARRLALASMQEMTDEEDAAITAAAMSDPDAMPFTDAEWEAARPTVRRGRPPAEKPKRQISLRIDGDVIEQFKAGGPGWQSRINEALRKAVGMG